MSIYHVIIKPETLKAAHQNKVRFSSGLFCPLCRDATKNKTHRFQNTRSLYFHVKEIHRDEISSEFVVGILNFVSIAQEMRMIE